ncbi:hypothetical protein J437_LFUL001876 [Ladona fulva]|uniref:Reverse transcriptase n=1 Tax=Ladona fulva TaxID=123851 RepID=A0A8K0NUE5_LADFU|nr:hypothetical protein J437_LFUL001876 [Ladona fulva]
MKSPKDVQEWWEVNSKTIKKIGEEVLGKISGKRRCGGGERRFKIKGKREAKKNWDLNGTQAAREVYRVARKNAKKAVVKAKAETINEALDSMDEERQLLRIAKAKDRSSKDITAVKQIKDASGVIIREDGDVRKRWKEYFHKLLNEENPRLRNEEGDGNELAVQDMSRVEVKAALKKVKNGKAVGADQIPVEIRKCLAEEGIDVLWDLVRKLSQQEKIPEEWRKSILVPLYKGKGQAYISEDIIDFLETEQKPIPKN